MKERYNVLFNTFDARLFSPLWGST